MMALFCCYGHYVVVVSKLPLNSSTLVYGSADASRTIMLNSDLEKLMKQVAQKLNLKGHNVREGTSSELRYLFGPVDIEGHKGLDGRFYVVDTARLFPPTTPVRGVRSCHLYKLMRAEAVRANPKALSSDAFSFFGKPDSEEHNAEVVDATERIVQLIGTLCSTEILLSASSIKDLLHSRGINLRFLGTLYLKAVSAGVSESALRKIVNELCARGAKSLLFRLMRDAVHLHSKKTIDFECRVIAALHFSRLSGVQGDSGDFWENSLTSVIRERFIFLDTDQFGRPSVADLATAASRASGLQLRAAIFDGGQSAVAELVATSARYSGVSFTDAISPEMRAGTESFRSFRPGDLELQLTAKRISVVPFVDTMRAAGKFEEAEAFYLEELRNRERALGKESSQVALTKVHLGELYAEQQQRVSDAERLFLEAEAILSNATADSHIHVADVQEKRCDLLLKYDRFEEAEPVLLSIMRSKEGLASCPLLEKLARVATRQRKFESAFSYYQQSLDIKRTCNSDVESIARTKNGQAQLLFAQQRYSDAISIGSDVVSSFRASKKGKTSSELGIALDNLAQLYSALGDHEAASPLFEYAFSISVGNAFAVRPNLTTGNRY